VQTIPDPVARHAATVPDRAALRVRDAAWTYGELGALVAAAAADREPGPADVWLDATSELDTFVELLAAWRRGQRVILGDPAWPAAVKAERARMVPPGRRGNATKDLPLDRALAVVFTSGTAGQAAGVELTAGQLYFGAMGAAVRLGHHLDDCWGSALPLFHVGGLASVTRALFTGVSCRLYGTFDAPLVAASIAHGDVSLLSLVPTMLARLLPHLKEVHPRVRAVVVGGAPLSPSLRDRAIAAGLPVCRTYGASETAAMVATDVPGRAVDDGQGIPLLPFVSVFAEDGVLVSRGPQVQNGQWISQDCGHVTAHAVTCTGRKDRVIICGGKKISPEVTERALENHPSVESAVCFAAADPADWGQQLVAWIQPTDGPCEGDVRGVLDALPKEQRPHALVFGTVPRGTSGKVSAATRDALEKRFHSVRDGRPLRGDVFLADSEAPPVARRRARTAPLRPLQEGEP